VTKNTHQSKKLEPNTPKMVLAGFFPVQILFNSTDTNWVNTSPSIVKKTGRKSVIRKVLHGEFTGQSNRAKSLPTPQTMLKFSPS